MKHVIFAAALAAASMSAAHADAINGLYNTGLGASGSQDIHYTLAAASSDTTITNTAPYITYDSGFPLGTWLANDSTSRWITPTATQAQTFDASANGVYTYTLTFNLTGYNAATAWFNGRLATDNSVQVLLNSNNIGGAVGFGSWSGFGASSGFNAGLNTLQFIVTNDALSGGNPTGLRVEFGESNVAAVPEAETYAMLLGGLALLGVVARRRRAK
jgi:opacity protein-like surface antigen